jgi:hypothetical protein
MNAIGRVLITIVAVVSAIGSYFADWNQTHILNPHWPPHAKFHNAQTMLMGTCLGLLSLYVLWIRKADPSDKAKQASVLAGLYWLTQAGAILFPRTALTDPEFRRGSQLPAQLILDAVMFAMLAIGYKLEISRIKRGSEARDRSIDGAARDGTKEPKR